MDAGYYQIYTGNGKGKTTAAMGLALRASGRNLKVFFGQFMKGQDYGERLRLPQLPGVTHVQFGDPGWCFKGKLKPAQIEQAQAGYEQSLAALTSGTYDLVILDEFNMALWFELIELEQALALVAARPAQVELVTTGRNAHEALIERADLVTEMREVKHYYTQGVSARIGIEN